MGTKTFRFVDGDQKSEAKFNFSEDLNAQHLQDWFERMAESAQHRIDLERAASTITWASMARCKPGSGIRGPTA